ncbi:MAG: ribonuclease E/G [Acetobacteraceae bacterium]
MDRPDRLLIASAPGERWLIGLAGDRLATVDPERHRRPDRVGEVHCARVATVAHGLAGAFVTLADGTSAFLPAEEADPAREDGGPIRPIEALVREGGAIVVRIVRAAMGGKGPRVSARGTGADRAAAEATVGAPRLLRPAPPRALSLLDEQPQVERILCDDGEQVRALRAARPDLADRIALHGGAQPLLTATLEAEIEALADPLVALGDGARLLIHATPAATLIDIDLAAGAGPRPAADRRRHANRRALGEIARQVVLRRLGGVILVDPAGLSPRRGAREALVREAQAACAGDPLGLRVLGVTRSGLLELVRPRVRPPLDELLGERVSAFRPSPETSALAALRALWRECLARPSARLRIRAGRDVAGAIDADEEAAAFVAARAGRAPEIVLDPGLAAGSWLVETAGDD